MNVIGQMVEEALVAYDKATPDFRRFNSVQRNRIRMRAALEAATALSQAEGAPNGIGDSVAINRIVEEIRSEHFAEAVEACVKIAEKYANSTYAKPTRNAGFCAGQIAAEMRALLPTRPREQEGECRHCKGTGTEADYVGDQIKCIEVECGFCDGTGRVAHPLPAASFQAGAEAMREEAAKVCQQWLDNYSNLAIDHSTPREYATGAVLDIKEVIEALPTPASSEGR